MAEQIENCPFCGKEAYFSQYTDNGSMLSLTWTVHCSDEACIGYSIEAGCDRKKTAAEAWNRRTPPSIKYPRNPYLSRDDMRFDVFEKALAEVRRLNEG